MSPWEPRYPELSTSELIARAVAAQQLAGEDSDEDLSYLVDLHSRVEHQTFEAAAAMLESPAADQRRLGCRILGELRGSGASPYAGQTRAKMTELLKTERDSTAVRAALFALGRNIDRDSLDTLIAFAGNADPDLRLVVAEFAADTAESESELDPRAVAALVGLTGDSDPEVRWYAVAAFAYDVRVDGRDIRAALQERIEDGDKGIEKVARHALAVREGGADLL